MAFNHQVFSQNTPSYMFERVLNMRLVYLSCFAIVPRGSNTKRLIYAKLITVFTPNKDFPHNLKSYVELQHSSQRKVSIVKEKLSTIKFDAFLFHFLCSNAPERVSVINEDGMCHFLHTSSWWHMLWCVRVQSHAPNGKD